MSSEESQLRFIVDNESEFVAHGGSPKFVADIKKWLSGILPANYKQYLVAVLCSTAGMTIVKNINREMHRPKKNIPTSHIISRDRFVPC